MFGYSASPLCSRFTLSHLAGCLAVGLLLSTQTSFALDEIDEFVTCTMAQNERPVRIVEKLYSAPAFFSSRDLLDPSLLSDFRCIFSGGLISEFESLHGEIAGIAASADFGPETKVPVPEGPVFLGNYEGATDFEIGPVRRVEVDREEVVIQLRYVYPGGRLDWQDIAVFEKIAGRWWLSDIRYDSSVTGAPSLRSRLRMTE